MKINIQGRIVEVDDSFLQLSEEDQNRTVDEIAQQLNIKPGQAQQPEPKTTFFDRIKQVANQPSRAIAPVNRPETGNLASPALAALNLIQRGLGLTGAQDYLRGGAETAATVGTALGGQALGAMGGVAEGMRSTAPRLGTPESNRLVTERAKAIQQATTYQPRSEVGQEMLSGLGSALQESKIPPYLAGIPPNIAASAARQAQPAVQQAARASTQPLVTAAAAPKNVLRGFVSPQEVSLKQIEPTMVKPAAVREFEAGKLNATQVLNPENIAQTGDILKTDMDRLAVILSNNEVPFTGQFGQGFGARLRQAFDNPYQRYLDPFTMLATGLATGLTTGVPIPLPFNPLVRGGQTLSDLYLQRRLGYSPRFASEFERRAAEEAANQAAVQRGVVSSTGPVAPPIQPNSIYNQQIAPYQMTPMVTPQVTGVSLGGQQSFSPVRTTAPTIPTAAPIPSAQSLPQTAAPTKSQAELFAEKVQAAGLTGEQAKQAVITSLTNDIKKRMKAEGVILSNDQAKQMAAKEAEGYFGQKQKAEAQAKQAERAAREQAAKQAEETRLAEEKAAREAYEASPEGQAARAKAEADALAEQEKKRKAEEMRAQIRARTATPNEPPVAGPVEPTVSQTAVPKPIPETPRVGPSKDFLKAMEELKGKPGKSEEPAKGMAALEEKISPKAPQFEDERPLVDISRRQAIKEKMAANPVEIPESKPKATPSAAKSFDVKSWVTSNQKDGKRRLDSHVLDDIEAQTGVKISNQDIGDISSMTSKELKAHMAKVYDRMRKRQGK